MLILNERDFIEGRRIGFYQRLIVFINIFLFLLMVAVVIFCTINFNLNILPKNSFTSYEESLLGPDCENLSFQDTVICLNDYVWDIFIFNITDDSIDLSLEDLITRGGDCNDWTKFYDDYLHHYGFNETKRVKIFMKEEEGISYYHVFLVAGSETGYCDIDMKDVNCFRFVGSEEEE